MAKIKRFVIVDPEHSTKVGSVLLDSELIPEDFCEPDTEIYYEFLREFPHKGMKIWMKYSKEGAELVLRIGGNTVRFRGREITELKNVIQKAERRKRSESLPPVIRGVKIIPLAEVIAKKLCESRKLDMGNSETEQKEQFAEELQ